MSLQATGTRIIIQRIEGSRQSAGGIILQTQQERPNGRVLSVGPAVTEDIKTGDILVVDWSKCGQFEHDGSTYHLVDQSTVFAVLE
jgi:co-chaperonin GroES (HSP10)